MGDMADMINDLEYYDESDYGQPYLTLDATCIKETPKAILVDIDGEEHWIPKSQLVPGGEVYEEGDAGGMRITEWIARQKGLV